MSSKKTKRQKLLDLDNTLHISGTNFTDYQLSQFLIVTIDNQLLWIPHIDNFSGAEAGGGMGGIYPPNNWTPSPPIITKCIPPNILNLPNLLNGDHLILRT